MLAAQSMTVPARRGRALYLSSGQGVKIINTYGQQVVDTWAFNANDPTEFMSMEHTRAITNRIMPRVGDPLVTNHRRPILTLVEDTTPGLHDTLIAACDRYRYELLGAPNHDNCTDNLKASCAELGMPLPEVPCPLNLFMNIPVAADHTIQFVAPVSKPGDFVVLRAEMDCIVVFSACPQDLVPVNGIHCTPMDVEVEVLNP